jgi:hypothetical protein
MLSLNAKRAAGILAHDSKNIELPTVLCTSAQTDCKKFQAKNFNDYSFNRHDTLPLPPPTHPFTTIKPIITFRQNGANTF